MPQTYEKVQSFSSPQQNNQNIGQFRSPGVNEIQSDKIEETSDKEKEPLNGGIQGPPTTKEELVPYTVEQTHKNAGKLQSTSEIPSSGNLPAFTGVLPPSNLARFGNVDTPANDNQYPGETAKGEINNVELIPSKGNNEKLNKGKKNL